MAKAINLENLSPLEQKAVKMRRAYQRQWRKNNPEKVKAIAKRHWLKKAVEQQKGEQTQNEV